MPDTITKYYVNRRPNRAEPWTKILDNLLSPSATDSSPLPSADYQIFGVTSLSELVPSDIKSINLDGVPSGTPVWAKFLQSSSSGTVQGRRCVIDSGFNAIVGGSFSALSPATCNLGSGNFSSTSGSLDCFLSKFDPSGNPLWTLAFGGGVSDGILGVAVDSSNNIIVGGNFQSTMDASGGRNPALGTLTLSNTPPRRQMFLAKYTSNGDIMWAVKFTGNFFDTVVDVQIDPSDNIILAGAQQSTNLTLNNGKTTSWTYNGFGSTTLIAKFSPGSAGVPGLCQWARIVGGDGQGTYPFRIAMISSGDFFVCGLAGGSTAVDVGGGPVNTTTGDNPNVRYAYVMKFSNSTGAALSPWTSSPHIYGNGSNDLGFDGISVHPTSGVVYIGGHGAGTYNFGCGNITSGSGGAATSHLWIGFDQSGNCQWNQAWGGDNPGSKDSTLSCAISGDGVRLLFGGTFPSDMNNLTGAGNPPGTGYYVMVLVTNGSHTPLYIWTKRDTGSVGTGACYDIAVRGTVVLTTGLWDGGDFNPGIADPAIPPSQSAFLCKYRL